MAEVWGVGCLAKRARGWFDHLLQQLRLVYRIEVLEFGSLVNDLYFSYNGIC